MAAVGELVNPDRRPLLVLLVEAWQVLEDQEASIEPFGWKSRRIEAGKFVGQRALSEL
jgi:hypothetical protein